MPQPAEQQIAVAETLALAEYRQHAGKLIEVDYICGYDRNGDGSDDWECRPPIIVKVTRNQNPHQGIRTGTMSGSIPTGMSRWFAAHCQNSASAPPGSTGHPTTQSRASAHGTACARSGWANHSPPD